MIVAVDHVQITVPSADVEIARSFYCGLLGLAEIPKPDSLKDRGGFWLDAGGHQVHVGVEDGVDRRATKAHVAFRVLGIDGWRGTLRDAGIEVFDGVAIPGYDRFEFRDPFGNRLELVQAFPSFPAGHGQGLPRRTAMALPQASEFASNYAEYVALVPEVDILAAMKLELDRTVELLSGVTDRDSSVCHPPFTWTIKQVVGHLADTERHLRLSRLAVCSRRHDAIARFRREPLRPVRPVGPEGLRDLTAEFEALRKSHIALFQNLPADAWDERHRQRIRDERTGDRLRHRGPRAAPHGDRPPAAASHVLIAHATC